MILLLSALATADEGMWLPEQLPHMSTKLAEMGLEIPADQLSDTAQAPLGAIVSLGFCSASFMSDQGLIGTNHHCVEGYLQYAAATDTTIPKQGFLAPDQAGELSAGPAARLYVVESITDVTEDVHRKVKRRTPDAKRNHLVELARKELIAACEAAPNHRCEVASFYSGQEYRLISKLEIQDVRLVYAPPQSVGSYGGEFDNWMWPRHAGDFSLLRAYVAPDGSSAPYSEDNVPYQPPHHLKVATQGTADGDFVMVAGYPGSTYRYRTARELRFARDVSYPWAIALSTEIKATLEAEAAKSEDAAARLQAPIGWVANGLKYRQGNLDNFQASGVVEAKEARWAELEAWVASTKANQKLYGPVLEELDELDAAAEQDFHQSTALGYMVWMVDLIGVSHKAYRFALESEKPDLERDRGYQDRDRARTVQRFEAMDQTRWIPADRAVFEILLQRYMELPEIQRVPGLDTFISNHGGMDAALDALYASDMDADRRVALMSMTAAEFEGSEDPWIQVAVILEQEYFGPKRAHDKEVAGAKLRLKPVYMDALLQSSDGLVYPDANSTLRVTVGHVKGYSPADAVWYTPHTSVAGMVAKRGEWPYDAPDFLVDAAPSAPESRWAMESIGDVPVDFLSTLDSTGGNSGSATLNAKGELVGFLFDGNYEAMSADWLFDPELTRSIHVDIRYAMWVLEVQGADWVLEELGL